MQNHEFQCKIRSQKGLILNEMRLNPNEWYTVAHFCGLLQHCFVGYKASSRIGELQKEGFLISRWSGQRTALGGRLKEYKLSPNYAAEFFVDIIFLVKKPEGDINQSLF